MAKIISIHSFRGGTGKSNVTANLAAQVAKRGYRVGVIDTDILSPGIHVLFGLSDDDIDKTLNDYLWGRCEIEDAAYEVGSRLKCNDEDAAALSGNLFLVPASLKTGEIARVVREGYDMELLDDGYRELIERLNLDFVFIDTHPGLNEETLLSIAISNMLIIILRPDNQDLQGSAVTVDVARKLDVPNLYLLVNKALSSYDFDEIKSQIEQTFDAPVMQVLPLSEDVARLASSGIFSLLYPDHQWSESINIVADYALAV